MARAPPLKGALLCILLLFWPGRFLFSSLHLEEDGVSGLWSFSYISRSTHLSVRLSVLYRISVVSWGLSRLSSLHCFGSPLHPPAMLWDRVSGVQFLCVWKSSHFLLQTGLPLKEPSLLQSFKWLHMVSSSNVLKEISCGTVGFLLNTDPGSLLVIVSMFSAFMVQNKFKVKCFEVQIFTNNIFPTTKRLLYVIKR